MQKSKIKRSIPILLITATLIIGGIFNINVVHADSLTMPYIALPHSFLVGSTSYGKEPYRVVNGNNVVDNDLDVRCIMFYEGTESNPTWKQMRCVTKSQGIGVHQWNGGNGDWTSLSSTYVVDGTTYYWRVASRSVNEWYTHMLTSGGLVDGNCTDAEKLQRMYSYTFGDNSTTPIDVGALMNVSLSTRYVNEQKNYSSQNLDVITWYGYQDNNYNDITGIEWFVDIRARKISYSGTSATDLLSRLQNEVILSNDYFDIASVSAKKGDYSITWGDVYNEFDISALQIFESESLFYTYGWVYEIRLRNADTEDTSEWQTIYTLSSLPPQSSTDFGNNVGFNSTATEIIYKVDTQNMNTSTNYNVTYNYYNDIPIGSDDYQQDVNGKPWYIILLEAITSMINTLIETVGGVFGDVINSILNFIKGVGVDVLDVFTNIFNGFSNNVDLFDTQIDNFSPNPDVEINDLKGILEIPFNILRSTGLAIVFLVPISLMILRLILV